MDTHEGEHFRKCRIEWITIKNTAIPAPYILVAPISVFLWEEPIFYNADCVVIIFSALSRKSVISIIVPVILASSAAKAIR